MAKIKVVAYTRISTGKQLDGHGLEVQTDAVEKYCKAREWAVVERYEDVYTGTTDQRPALQRLLMDAPKGNFEAVVFYDFSRFARNTLHLLQLVEELKGRGVRICSVKDAIDAVSNPAVGELMITVLGAFAQFEHETIKRRMNGARKKLWKEGRVYIGRAPVGYKVVDGKLEMDPNTAPVVKRIFELYVGGLAMGKIGNLLRKEGLKTPAGKWYTSGGISHILRNELYTGHMVGNQYVYEGGRRTETAKPEDEHINITAPALVTRAQFKAVQAKIKQNRNKTKKAGGLQWAWLRDACTCAVCGGPIRPAAGGKLKSGQRKRYYTCTWRRQSERVLMEAGRERCTMPLIPAEKLHAFMWAKLMERIGLGTNREQLMELIDPARYQEAIDRAAQTVTNWRAEVNRLDTARQNIHGMLEDGVMDAKARKEFMGKLQTNAGHMAAAEGHLKEAQDELDNLVQTRDNDAHVKRFLEDNAGALKGLVQKVAKFDDAQRYDLIMAMLAGQVVIGHDGRVWQVQQNTLKMEVNLPALAQLFGDKIMHDLCPSPPSPCRQRPVAG
jgi:site-specific DNA recombinase